MTLLLGYDTPSILLVGGTFDDGAGKPSGYVSRLAEGLVMGLRDRDIKLVNGGAWQELEQLVKQLYQFRTIIWMPNVSNDREKLIGDIKKLSPHAILVSSKRNDGGKYSFMELVARALATRSNLLLELSKTDGQVVTTILDPLGNTFITKEADIEKVALSLASRIHDLYQGIRVSSVCIGETCEPPPMTADLEQFFGIIRTHAQTFHELIHGAANPSRLLGNASFRCESGFPSFKAEGKMYVSKRDIDKRDIGIGGFVPVSLSDEHTIGYWGPSKPSVDTPINLQLYNQLPNIRYMIHSHTYIQGAPFTWDVMPCGDLREVAEVLLKVDASADSFYVNLRGHGSLAGAASPALLKHIPYVAREVPEIYRRAR